MSAPLFLALGLASGFAVSASAHEPLFMLSHEAPGKGAFDFHTEVETHRQGERETEVVQEFGLGLTRDFAAKVSLPFAWKEEPGGTRGGLADPRVRFKWRFWDLDRLAEKYAVAAALSTTLPVGRAGLGRERPILSGGLAHGREGLRWYYFVDARYRYAVADPNRSKPGDELRFDASYGLRPWVRGLEKTDVVFFLEANYLHEARGRLPGDRVDFDSGGDFLFLSPEVLISPFNRLMFRAGLQIPVAQSLKGSQARKGVRVLATTEMRFGI